MTKMSEPKAPGIVKMILLGDSGTGKTGSLASLVKAGYKLRIIDMDNKIEGGILPLAVKRLCPELASTVEYESLRDKMKSTAAGPLLDGPPMAFTEALGFMQKWSDGTSPAAWGPSFVFVLDSLTFFSDAAFNWVKALNPGAKDPRQWFYSAQQAVEDTMAVLTSSSFSTNVVVISHVSWQNRPDGTMKGYPASVGSALGPTIPAYFENMAMCQTLGGKRLIQTAPTVLVDLKNPAALTMAPALPVETGLATFFQTLKA